MAVEWVRAVADVDSWSGIVRARLETKARFLLTLVAFPLFRPGFVCSCDWTLPSERFRGSARVCAGRTCSSAIESSIVLIDSLRVNVEVQLSLAPVIHESIYNFRHIPATSLVIHINRSGPEQLPP